MYYRTVPKDPQANVEWRQERLAKIGSDRGRRRAIWQLCKHDILFWVNAFCFTYDPRKIATNPHLPFVTWEFQDEALLTLSKHVGTSDVGIEKARDMGASWLCLVAFLHQWQFFPGQAFMVVSRNEDLVDASGNPDSLFWKLDYLLRNQPRFLVPP